MLWVIIIIEFILLVLAVVGSWGLLKRTRQLTDEVEYLRQGHDISQRVSYLMHNGRAGEAIAIYAKATGMSVGEAKTAVQIIAKHNPQI